MIINRASLSLSPDALPSTWPATNVHLLFFCCYFVFFLIPARSSGFEKKTLPRHNFDTRRVLLQPNGRNKRETNLVAAAAVVAAVDDSPVDDGRRMAKCQTLETMALPAERVDQDGRLWVVRQYGRNCEKHKSYRPAD